MSCDLIIKIYLNVKDNIEIHKCDIAALFWNSVLAAKSVCLAGYNEKRLLHDLLDTYNTLERPVLNESDPLQLSFGLTLMQIIDVLFLKRFLWNILGGMSYKVKPIMIMMMMNVSLEKEK
uniref:Neurotransmitter-gated ion-channel ligand-binding domain-containing protein n=1 Tax=Glossina pallidipes TaxID=7398 RepID=A0A1A9ZH70_GLOPL